MLPTLRLLASILQAGLLLTLLIPIAFAQPPVNEGYFLNGKELAGNPRPVIALGGDGQDCAFQCSAIADCVAFNFEPPLCADKLCQSPSGCCWLLQTADSLNTTSSSCGGSMIMRPAPESVPPIPPSPSPPASAKNILYLLADDMRPDVSPHHPLFPCVPSHREPQSVSVHPRMSQVVPFGASWMVTPNLQSLAASGTVFNNAYCQISVCSPSRMSFLTGRYPHHTLTWNFLNHFRQADCEEASKR
jgi:hypothetical protein